MWDAAALVAEADADVVLCGPALDVEVHPVVGQEEDLIDVLEEELHVESKVAEQLLLAWTGRAGGRRRRPAGWSRAAGQEDVLSPELVDGDEEGGHEADRSRGAVVQSGRAVERLICLSKKSLVVNFLENVWYVVE